MADNTGGAFHHRLIPPLVITTKSCPGGAQLAIFGALGVLMGDQFVTIAAPGIRWGTTLLVITTKTCRKRAHIRTAMTSTQIVYHSLAKGWIVR